MSKTVKLARRATISLIAFPLLILGIILIPLPGPGLLVCFAALFLLSLEFEWAASYFAKVKTALQKIYVDAQAKADKITESDKPKSRK